MTLYNNNDQTWFSDVFKDPGNHPRGPADVNAQKNMYDTYIMIEVLTLFILMDYRTIHIHTISLELSICILRG